MATIHDVALDANVSPTTVSRYINNRIELPPATAARIDAAIAKLDYRPNLLARRLSTGRTEAIGLVILEIREPFFAELASAVEDEGGPPRLYDLHVLDPFGPAARDRPRSTGCTTGTSMASS